MTKYETVQQESVVVRTSRLQSMATLAIFETRFWQANKHAKDLTKEICESKKANTNMVHTTKRLLDQDALKNIALYRREAKTLHEKLTMPWHGVKFGLLPNKLLFQYKTEMSNIRDKHDRAVMDFIQEYPALRDAAIAANGTLLAHQDYPPVECIADKFAILIDHQLLPPCDSKDLRTTLGAEEFEYIAQSAQAQFEKQQKEVIRDVWQRMASVVNHMVERLSEFERIEDPATGREKLKGDFRRTLVTNITDVLNLVPHLNVFDDKHITSVADEMRKSLIQFDMERLKIDDAARIQTLLAAEEIQKKMEMFL